MSEHTDGFNRIVTTREGNKIRVDCYQLTVDVLASKDVWRHVYGGLHPIEALTGVNQ